jgi:hypothetical protein
MLSRRTLLHGIFPSLLLTKPQTLFAAKKPIYASKRLCGLNQKVCLAAGQKDTIAILRETYGGFSVIHYEYPSTARVTAMRNQVVQPSVGFQTGPAPLVSARKVDGLLHLLGAGRHAATSRLISRLPIENCSSGTLVKPPKGTFIVDRAIGQI